MKDYRKWRAVFDAHGGKRRELGSNGGVILRNTKKPDEIIVITEWGSLAKAREFTRWGDPEEIGALSGVGGDADCFFLEKVDDIPA